MEQLAYESQQYVCGQRLVNVLVHTDIGGRASQEDTFTVAAQQDSVFAAVCDGMGGMHGGTEASQTAASALTAAYQQKDDLSVHAQFYLNCLDALDEAVYELRDETGRRLGAGTTVVSVLIEQDQLTWFSVGDSRLYLIRGKEVVQATADHNYRGMLDALLSDGAITQQQYADELPKAAALTSYLGIGGVRQYDVNTEPFPLQNGDLLLLCSDGLYHAADPAEAVRRSGTDADALMKALLDAVAAVPSELRDNTTWMLMQYLDKGDVKL